ncbi:MAG: hypothetical protein IT581_13690 [Verrucomicrobiales bacterium]|nr:hypothetical protein [Verrucomicrobiales bacterium]
MSTETKTDTSTMGWAGWTDALKAPISLTVDISGRAIRLDLRRLKAAERAAIIGWYDEHEQRSSKLLPPTAGRGGEFNENERSYRENLARLRRIARAMTVAVVWADAGQAMKDAGVDLLSPDRVLEFVESNLPEHMIESIYLCSLSDGISITVGDRLSFTSAGG